MKIDLNQYEKLLHEGKLVKILEGIPASKGIAIGKPKVGSAVKYIEKIERGDIIVVPTTTPPDVRSLLECDGIITDTGGYTSHAALLASDLGIPCIVGTKDSTKLLVDYDRILMDGYSGNVYIVKEV